MAQVKITEMSSKVGVDGFFITAKSRQRRRIKAITERTTPFWGGRGTEEVTKQMQTKKLALM